jgi:hypothetical protein
VFRIPFSGGARDRKPMDTMCVPRHDLEVSEGSSYTEYSSVRGNHIRCGVTQIDGWLLTNL